MKIQKWPDDPSVLQLNKDNMNISVFNGLYEETIEFEGENKHFYTYITDGIVNARSAVVAAIPSGCDPAAYMELSGLKDLADKEKLYVHVFTSNEEYRDIEKEARLMNKIGEALIDSHNYVVLRENIYALGIGEGAAAAHIAVMQDREFWSGLASVGGISEDECSVIKKAVMKHTGSFQMPTWIICRGSSQTLKILTEYWKTQNDSVPDPLKGWGADEVYFADAYHNSRATINSEKIAQLRITYGKSETGIKECIPTIWDFLKMVRKHLGEQVKDVRYYTDPEIYGTVRRSIQWKGFNRFWWEYVPDAVKESGKEVPLLVMMHGRRQSPEALFDLSNMSKVAEERQFIVVFAQAGIFRHYPDGIENVALWQGVHRGETMDSLGFIREMIKDVSNRLPVDSSRIYACGFSSGACMCGTLSEQMTDIFAAVSCWSGLILSAPDINIDPENDGRMYDSKPRNKIGIQVIIGENDVFFGGKNNELGLVDECYEYISWRIDADNLNPVRLHSSCGKQITNVFRSQDGIPIIEVDYVKDMPHTVRPFESWLAYDAFLSRYSRCKDGTLCYMGEKVE